jgi:predicted Zn-dependent protease
MVRAGYSAQGVESFWQRLAKTSPKGINRAKTHPTFPDRYLRIRAAQDEILAKQKAGKPLLPNFIAGSAPSGS